VIRSSGVCFGGGGGGGVLLRRFPGSSHAKTGEQGSGRRNARATACKPYCDLANHRAPEYIVPFASSHFTCSSCSLRQLDLSERSNISRLK